MPDRAVDATRPLPGAPPPSTVADIANGMGLSGLYGAGLEASALSAAATQVLLYEYT